MGCDWGRMGLLLPGLLLPAWLACDPASGHLDAAAAPISPARPEPAETGSFPVPVQERGGVRVGAEAPNFQLRDLEGRSVTLASYRGRVVLVNFWATWCGPCRVEMPGMEALYREFSRKDFEILAVSTDQQGAAVTRPFRDELGLTFPILHDSEFRVGVAYGARTLPMTFLVDRRGIITHRIFGARNWQTPEGRQLIKTLVKAR
ncbi:MAG: TlpA disulfide reductase family protein [Nitrospirota bacterium]